MAEEKNGSQSMTTKHFKANDHQQRIFKIMIYPFKGILSTHQKGCRFIFIIKNLIKLNNIESSFLICVYFLLHKYNDFTK